MENADNLCFRRFLFGRTYSNNGAVNGLNWHKNIVRTAQTVTAQVTVNQEIPTIPRFIMCRMASLDIISKRVFFFLSLGKLA